MSALAGDVPGVCPGCSMPPSRECSSGCPLRVAVEHSRDVSVAAAGDAFTLGAPVCGECGGDPDVCDCWMRYETSGEVTR